MPLRYERDLRDIYPFSEFSCSCKGRYRDSEPSRGDIDDALGK